MKAPLHECEHQAGAEQAYQRSIGTGISEIFEARVFAYKR